MLQCKCLHHMKWSHMKHEVWWHSSKITNTAHPHHTCSMRSMGGQLSKAQQIQKITNPWRSEIGVSRKFQEIKIRRVENGMTSTSYSANESWDTFLLEISRLQVRTAMQNFTSHWAAGQRGGPLLFGWPALDVRNTRHKNHQKFQSITGFRSL